MLSGLRRLLAVILCGVLLLTLPLSVLASETAPTEIQAETQPEETGTEPTVPETEDTTPTETAATEPEESTLPANTDETTAPTTPSSEPTDPTGETSPGEETDDAAPTEETEETEPTETAEETVPIELFSLGEPEIEVELDWNLYFGQLHSHTDISDGSGTVEEAFTYAAQVENLDFFAVTDHSDSLDNAESGSITADGTAISQEWAAGRAAARAVTDSSFVGIFGYEMSWPQGKNLGHLNTFGTPGWQSWKQEEFSNSLERYYQALTTVPGAIGQFNHPGPHYGDFENFGCYSPEYDRQICLLEVAGEGDFTAYGEYTKALDAGWHVAPTTSQNNHHGCWGDARQDRTVVLAEELTEPALFDAMRQHRVYATADGDLTVYYELCGHIMGSTLGSVQDPEITVYLSDPTDQAVGLVEVIADGEKVVESAQVDTAEELLYLYPPGGYSYYYLRIIQPDGDIAVTAPVWTASFNDMGIAAFSASTQTPIQGLPLDLTVTLYNDERVNCTIRSLDFYQNNTLIHSAELSDLLEPEERLNYTFSYTHDGLGTTDIRVTAAGAAKGQERSWSRTLTLQYRPNLMVTGLLVDGSHGSIPALQNLTTLAEQVNMNVTVFDGEMPEGGEILVIFSPDEEFEPDFLERVLKFVQKGGSLILCGRGDGGDGCFHSASALNRLLETLGATLRFYDNTAIDPVNHGSAPDQLFPTVFNTDSSWCRGLTSAQYYAHLGGCTLDPGEGTWLVQGFPSTKLLDTDGDGKTGRGHVLLAAEATPWGGQILAAGSPFLSDLSMPLPQNKWAAPGSTRAFWNICWELRRRSSHPLISSPSVQGNPGRSTDFGAISQQEPPIPTTGSRRPFTFRMTLPALPSFPSGRRAFRWARPWTSPGIWMKKTVCRCFSGSITTFCLRIFTVMFP